MLWIYAEGGSVLQYDLFDLPAKKRKIDLIVFEILPDVRRYIHSRNLDLGCCQIT